jgi:hypothetical protein
MAKGSKISMQSLMKILGLRIAVSAGYLMLVAYPYWNAVGLYS